jgi:hypothetical protein
MIAFPFTSRYINGNKMGYKTFKKGLKGFDDFEYEIDKIYEGQFQFCHYPLNLDDWYKPSDEIVYAIIEIVGDVEYPYEFDSFITIADKMKIIKQISRDELVEENKEFLRLKLINDHRNAPILNKQWADKYNGIMREQRAFQKYLDDGNIEEYNKSKSDYSLMSLKSVITSPIRSEFDGDEMNNLENYLKNYRIKPY